MINQWITDIELTYATVYFQIHFSEYPSYSFEQFLYEFYIQPKINFFMKD